jgi:hypothetical protein
MKNTILIIAVMALGLNIYASNPASNVLVGESSTNFGSYQLTPSENCTVINDVAYKTWSLTYSGTNEDFQVLVSPGINGNCCYIVRSDSFEIEYVKENGKFGVKMVDGFQRQLKRRDVMKRLNYDNYLSQKVLTTKEKTGQECLSLAACFLPLLLS